MYCVLNREKPVRPIWSSFVDSVSESRYTERLSTAYYIEKPETLPPLSPLTNDLLLSRPGDQREYRGRIERKTLCTEPYAGVDYNLTLCPLQSRLQQIYHRELYARVDFIP
jgi:hypothetical protein